MEVKETNAELLRTLVSEGEKPIILDFYAQWCGPCKVYAPILEQFASKMKDQCIILKADIDKEHELANQFKIKSVPTTILFSHGKPVIRMTGVMNDRQLREILSENTHM
ncbi:MAG: thioredoxin [Clostridia bacterium]|nr:thioredoxin [Clostridia bacterium]